MTKYHSSGLWSNTCCGHPRPGEQLMTAACRRLKAEMGLSCALDEISSFIYLADVDNGLIEHDHLLIGRSDLDPTLNRDEAIDWKWTSFAVLEQEVDDHPENFTFWLKAILDSEMLSAVRQSH